MLNDPLYEACDRCNDYIVSWVTLALSPEIAQSVIWHDVAGDLWRDLKHMYSQGDIFKMDEIDDELSTIKQATNCACDLEIVKNYREDAYVMRFLKGLNEVYSYVKSQVMLMKPMPKIDEAFSLLLQQERQIHQTEPILNARTLKNASSNTPQANRGRGRDRRAGRGRGRGSSKQCSYYGKTGHLVDVCYKKHGMPPHFKQGGTSFINNVVAKENSDTNNNVIGESLP
ncbi:uncharacterized protein [Arachis hypogaea]|uniref:uncharacterized protein n=1 Tax=Arachis hypogaea TaxID=3818 RepID=UPI003B20CCFD